MQCCTIAVSLYLTCRRSFFVRTQIVVIGRRGPYSSTYLKGGFLWFVCFNPKSARSVEHGQVDPMLPSASLLPPPAPPFPILLCGSSRMTQKMIPPLPPLGGSNVRGTFLWLCVARAPFCARVEQPHRPPAARDRVPGSSQDPGRVQQRPGGAARGPGVPPGAPPTGGGR